MEKLKSAVKCPNCGDLVIAESETVPTFCSCKKVEITGNSNFSAVKYTTAECPETTQIKIIDTLTS